MSSVYVFRYLVDNLLAVAIVPADRATIHYAGRHKLVHFTNGPTWHKLVVDPADEIRCMSPEDAVPFADEMHRQLVDSGQISPVPLPEAPRPAPRQAGGQGNKLITPERFQPDERR